MTSCGLEALAANMVAFCPISPPACSTIERRTYKIRCKTRGHHDQARRGGGWGGREPTCGATGHELALEAVLHDALESLPAKHANPACGLLRLGLMRLEGGRGCGLRGRPRRLGGSLRCRTPQDAVPRCLGGCGYHGLASFCFGTSCMQRRIWDPGWCDGKEQQA